MGVTRTIESREQWVTEDNRKDGVKGAVQQHNGDLRIENNKEVKCISKRLIHV
jgi:hypothetical protein